MDRKRDPKITAAMNRLVAALPAVGEHEPLELSSLVRGGVIALKVIVGFMESLGVPTADIVARLREVTEVLVSALILPETIPEPRESEPTVAPDPDPEPIVAAEVAGETGGPFALDVDPEPAPTAESDTPLALIDPQPKVENDGALQNPRLRSQGGEGHAARQARSEQGTSGD